MEAARKRGVTPCKDQTQTKQRATLGILSIDAQAWLCIAEASDLIAKSVDIAISGL